jgi:flagellar hook assembly protein FlgD
LGRREAQRPSIEIGVFPNPLNPSTRIVLELATEAPVNAVVYDVAGHEVVRLWSGRMPAGLNQLEWSGHDSDGRPVASGLYFLRITTSGASHVRKLVVVR